MKKKIGFLIISLLALTVGLFLGTKTKAAGAPSLIQTQGASVRTIGKPGIKFTANVDDFTGVTEHGFYVAKGDFNLRDMTIAIKNNDGKAFGNKLIKKQAVSNDLEWTLTVFNIDEANYTQSITAVAYIVFNGEVITTTPVARSIGYVANKALIEGESGAIVTGIAGYVNTNYYAAGMKDANTFAFQDASTTTLTDYKLVKKGVDYTLPNKLGYNAVYKDNGAVVTNYDVSATKEFTVETSKKTFTEIKVDFDFNNYAFGTKVDGKGIVGEDLFTNINDAIAADVRKTPETKLTINVGKGEYKSDFTLPSYTELLGNYANDDSVGATPREDSEKSKIYATITLPENVEKVKIAGFDFADAGKVKRSDVVSTTDLVYAEEITIENNVVVRNNDNAFFNGGYGQRGKIIGLIIKNNVFTDGPQVANPGTIDFIYTHDVDKLLLEGNKFNGIKGNAVRVFKETKGLDGTLTIINNEFKNIGKTALEFREVRPSWYNCQIEITGNKFEDIRGDYVINFANSPLASKEDEKYTIVKVNQNKFTGGSKLFNYGKVPSKNSEFMFNEIKFDFSQNPNSYILSSDADATNYGSINTYGNKYMNLEGVVQYPGSNEPGTINVGERMRAVMKNFYTANTMSITDLKLKVGETKEADITFNPNNNCENAVFAAESGSTWVAELVIEEGKLKIEGVHKGTATITYSFQKLNDQGVIVTISDTFNVTVE